MSDTTATLDEEWTTEHESIRDELEDLEVGDTFAIATKRSYGVVVEHITVLAGPFIDTRNYAESTLAEPYDVVLKGERRRTPSADFADSMLVSFDPETSTAYLKQYAEFEELLGIATATLEVSYETDVAIAAKCDCGQQTKVPVRDSQLPMAGESMVDTDHGFATPCCRSTDWTTILTAE